VGRHLDRRHGCDKSNVFHPLRFHPCLVVGEYMTLRESMTTLALLGVCMYFGTAETELDLIHIFFFVPFRFTMVLARL
jgi:hypothetical protein